MADVRIRRPHACGELEVVGAHGENGCSNEMFSCVNRERHDVTGLVLFRPVRSDSQADEVLVCFVCRPVWREADCERALPGQCGQTGIVYPRACADGDDGGSLPL